MLVEHLPPGNAVQRELHGRWDDHMWLLYDASRQLRILNTAYGNMHRKKGTPLQQPTYLPTPPPVKGEQQQVVTAEQEQARDHLLAVVNRPNPH